MMLMAENRVKLIEIPIHTNTCNVFEQRMSAKTTTSAKHKGNWLNKASELNQNFT